MIEIGLDKGILVKILGEDISRGMAQLPQPGPDQPAKMQAVIEVAHYGRVRITYRLNRSPRRKVNLWFWTAFHAVAEPLQEDQPSDAPDPAHQQD